MASVKRQGTRVLMGTLCMVQCTFLPCCTSTKKADESPTLRNPIAAMNMQAGAEQTGNPLLPNKGDPGAVNYNVSTSEELEKIDNGAEGEVFFTDPDNPDKEIEGITAAFESRRNGNGWMSDYGRALRFAHRESRPLLIWFHDSVISPKSSQLGEQLLDTPKFNAWCKDRVVRVKLDSGAALQDDKTQARYTRNAIDGLALKYGLRKRPAIAVVSPRGKFIVGVDGYSGFLQEVDDVIRQGVADCETDMERYKAKLEPKGYRTWHSARGNMSLFAKLQRFDEQNQLVYLKEYGGRITKTKLSRFSQEDIDYIKDYLDKKAAKQYHL